MAAKVNPGYSLVGVLSAMIIFMIVLVPLLKLQGNIRSKVYEKNTYDWQTLIERDLNEIRMQQKPPKQKLIEADEKPTRYRYWIYIPQGKS